MAVHTLQLVSHPLCPYVHRAAAMLLEKNVPFELRYVDLKAKPDWFLAISPRGKVPVLVADGTPLFESSAILEFLDETHAPQVLPDDPFERARQRAWIEVSNDLFMAHYKLVSIKSWGDLETLRDAVRAVLARFETEIRGEFFAGDEPGLVDFAVAPVLFRIRLLERWTGIELTASYPRVDAWTTRLAGRPSVAKGVPDDFEARHRVSLGELGILLSRQSV